MTAAPPAANATGLRVHHPATAEALVATLRECWSAPRADLFDFDLAVVPGPGFRRWLSQQWALADGICAGIGFESLPGLRRRLDPDDPWQPERLVWPLLRLASADPGPTVLQRHLEASREPYSACLRIARQFAGYATHRPGMLRAWELGEDQGPEGEPLAQNAWQAQLWRTVAGALGETPAGRRERLLAGLLAAPAPGVPARMAILAPTRLDEPDLELFGALAHHHRVDLLVLSPSPRRWPTATGGLPRREYHRPIGHPLNDALAAISDERALLIPGPPADLSEAVDRPDTLLGRLQADLAADRSPATPYRWRPEDRSVQLHLSHGLHRQVEVLREVIARELSADPGLEPRQIAVVTPAVDDIAPLITAAFMLPAQSGDHPGHSFRVRLADRSVAQTNPLVGLLLQLLELPDGRFEASTLLDLCAQPAIATRFGFTDDRQARLVELVERAGIRWGLSGPQRATFGLGRFPQNTWLAGVQRMLLGVTLSETDLVTAKTVLPLDDVGSSDIELIGGLAELLGRLSRLLTTFESQASIAEWAERCRSAVESLVRLPPDQQWQLADLWAGLAQVAARDDSTPLGRHGATRVFTAEFGDRPARGSFGAGSLLVCGPTSLRHVPHRVIILLGWDADRYPRSGRAHGDDLLGAEPRTGDPSPVLADRQLLLDTLHAARERLIVIARGRSDTTNEPVPLAAPLQELFDAVDATVAGPDGPVSAELTVSHPLQPFDPGYFDPDRPELFSVDPLAFRGALAAASEPRPARNRYRFDALAPPELSAGVSLDELSAFFGHPVRQLLKHRVGFTMSEPNASSDVLPLQLDPLARWKIGNRVLRQLSERIPAQTIRHAEWLRGEVPPAELGRRELDRIFAEAESALHRVPTDLGEPATQDLALTVDVPGHGPLGLHGRVTSHGDDLLQLAFSSLGAKHRIEAWIHLLALTVTEGRRPRAVVVGKNRAVALSAPPPDQAAALLGRYLALYRLGLSQPLPIPPRVGERLAQLRRRSTEAEHPVRIARPLTKSWEWDRDAAWSAFFDFPDLLTIPATVLELPEPVPAEPTLIGALAQLIWAPLLEWEVER